MSSGHRKRLSDQVERFLMSLTPEERMLLVLKRQLYEGSWEMMLSDLRARLACRPYVFKLANRIRDDIQRIERLWTFERGQNVDLADYVNLDALESA